MSAYDKIRVALEMARELVPAGFGMPAYANEALAALADLAAAVAITATRDETIAELELRLRISRQSNKELREAAERAEARLAAIDAAPTVAYVNSLSQAAPNYLIAELLPPQDRPPIGTELIARPAKD